MTAQQLTPELTQPNVLVEIDHGPTMGLHQEDQRPVQGKFLPGSMNITSDLLVSASTFNSPELVHEHVDHELEHVDGDGCPEPGLDCGSAALNGMQSDGKKVKDLGDGPFWVSGKPGSGKSALLKSVAESSNTSRLITEWAQPCRPAVVSHYFFTTRKSMQNPEQDVVQTLLKDPGQIEQRSTECFLTCRGPSWARFSRSEFGVLDTGKEKTPFIGMHCLELMASDNQQRDEPSHMDDRSYVTMRSMGRDSTTKGNFSSEGPRPPLFLQDQREALFRNCDLEERYRSFSSDGNVDSEPVIHEMKMAGDDKPNHAFQTELSTRDLPTGRIPKTQSQADTDDFEPPLRMSSPNGAKTNFNIGSEELTRELFMWMIEYNLMTSQRHRKSLPRLSIQSTELLLDLVATAISCLHVLLPSPAERTARARQWTEKVHCLLDDPG